MQYRVVSLAGPGGQLASSLPASAAAVGIALGAYAVITGLIIAVICIPVAWAASFLKPPVIADATGPAVAADMTPSLRNHGRINHLEDAHERLAA